MGAGLAPLFIANCVVSWSFASCFCVTGHTFMHMTAVVVGLIWWIQCNVAMNTMLVEVGAFLNTLISRETKQ